MNRRTCNWRYFSSVIYYSKCRSGWAGFAIDSTSHSLGPPLRPPHNHRSFVLLQNLQTLDSTSIYSPHCTTPEHWRGKERSFHIFMENRSSSQFTITSLITMNKFSHFILCFPSCARSSPIHSGIFRSSWVIRFYPMFAIALVSGCYAAVLHFPSRWFCVGFFLSPKPLWSVRCIAGEREREIA